MIDLLSDTVTIPPSDMLDAMRAAVVGDDVYGEDPTVNAFEQKCAQRLGKEAACFVPSGTMANLLSILASCPRGSEVLVGDQSDIYNYQAGGASALGGVVYHPVETQQDGRLLLDSIARAIRDASDPQCAPARLLCLEIPHNRCGGLPLPIDYLTDVGTFCRENGLGLHLDAARIFNAAVAMEVSASELAREATSLQICFSKSLSAPVGSAVVGSEDLVAKVRRLRKVVGGGMRQAGYLCAAADFALEHMVDRLADDHRRAALLAHGLTKISGLSCQLGKPHTNMVFFELTDASIPLRTFLATLERHGVRMGELGYGRIRAAVHRHITDDHVKTVLIAVAAALDECRAAKCSKVEYS
ncbi:MAG: GntG family PLP-dependent aldolase [Sulfitobacter sp.]|uniref:GntG family PLP-dependent aldolase n=1 Tax=Roseibium sp. TaxID=1936156 RepID=UPI003265697B